MKKVLFIAVVAVAFLSSCSKDRTCTCTTTSTAPGFVAGPADVTVYTDSKKHDARLFCQSTIDKVAANGAIPAYDVTTSCELK